MKHKNRKTKTILIVIAAIICVLLVVWFVSDHNKGSTSKKEGGKVGSEETLGEESFSGNNSSSDSSVIDKDGNRKTISDSYESHVDSPKIEKQTTLQKASDEDTQFDNASSGYQVTVPAGYEVSKSGSIIYIREKSTETQIALVYTTQTFTDPKQVMDDAANYVYRMTGYFNGKEVNVTNYGASGKLLKQVGDYSVRYETAEMWFNNPGDKNTIKLPSYDYFTVADGHGVMMFGCSMKKSSDEVFSMMDSVLGSLSQYVPTEADLSKSIPLTQYKSKGKDNVSFSYPANWKVSKNDDGMIIIKAPSNDTSYYAGMIIEYIADEKGTIVNNYAQFSGDYEAKLLLPYFIQDVSTEDFTYESNVNEMDINAKIKNKPAIRYTITDCVDPRTNAVWNSMPSDNMYVKNLRYAFTNHGISCVINFILPNDSCEQVADTVMNSMEIN